MEAVYSPEARETLQSLPEKVKDSIREGVEELKSNPTGHENSKIIKIAGREVYRLKVKEERSGKIDHRVVYDIEKGKIRIYSIFHRDEGYSEKRISENL